MKKDYACPRCGESTISFWQRYFASFMFKATCSKCKARVYPWILRSIIFQTVAYIVWIPIGFLAFIFLGPSLFLLTIIALWIITDILRFRWIPLRYSEHKDRYKSAIDDLI